MSEVNDIVWAKEAILDSTEILKVANDKPGSLCRKFLIDFSTINLYLRKITLCSEIVLYSNQFSNFPVEIAFRLGVWD